ncbi:DUF7282 domain-containing protein [Halalkalicoccus ordinarius]|uniref:DUF7282 domain-containing protein n=1 Tax=Halalkalicoccus ordinarius TaxID=3116651 RepID=UPI00300E8EC3
MVTAMIEIADNSDGTEDESSDKTTLVSNAVPSRRRILQAIGGVGAALAITGNASAHPEDTKKKHDHGRRSVSDHSFSRFSDQVTDGTYVVVDEVNITTEEGGFMSIHLARPEEGIADVGFINPEDGSPQNAADTIIGYSEYLEPGLHQNLKVPIFQDEELNAVPDDVDRLPEPAVLVSLPHIDSNENEDWDFFDEENEDPAYGPGVGEPTDGLFAPPGPDRPTDIAAVVPLKKHGEEFELSR